jgi:hypothetical protein
VCHEHVQSFNNDRLIPKAVMDLWSLLQHLVRRWNDFSED